MISRLIKEPVTKGTSSFILQSIQLKDLLTNDSVDNKNDNFFPSIKAPCLAVNH